MTRILVVEDDPDIRSMLQRGLAAEGFTVSAAERASEALADARETTPAAIVLDIMLPDSSGYDICRSLRSEGFAGPILFPSFAGATLLLFTNAFSAYATAAALVSQGSPLLPLQIGATFRSEVILGQENLGKAMALAMVVVVAVVMALYALLDKRASRWMQR